MNNFECKNIFAKLHSPKQYSERLKGATVIVCSSDKIFAVNRFQETPEFFVLLIINNAFVSKDRILNFHPISIFFVTFESQFFYPIEKNGSKVRNGYISRDLI